MSVKGAHTNVSTTAGAPLVCSDMTAHSSAGGEVKLIQPDAPVSVPKSTGRTYPKWLLVGLMAPGLMACTMGAHAQTTQGAPIPESGIEAPADPSAAVLTPAQQTHPVTGRSARRTDYPSELSRLDGLLRNRRITAGQYARAKNLLFRALVNKDPSINLPLTARGRIDLEVLVLPPPGPGEAARSRGEIAFQNAARELERRIQVTPRQLAKHRGGGFPESDITASDVQDILLDAVKRVPLNELTGGRQLADLIESLPLGSGIGAADMSFNELEVAFSDRGQDWFDTNIRPRFEGKEVQTGIALFGAITAVRAASPEVAELMDSLDIDVEIYDARHFNDNLRTQAELAYRNGSVLPDLDLRFSSVRQMGAVTLMGDVRTTLATEGDDWFTGTATAGARWSGELTSVDLSGKYRLDGDQWSATLRTTYFDPNTTWHASGAFIFQGGDDANIPDLGRYRFELDATKEINWGNATGDFGFYSGMNLENQDIEGGVVFRLRF